MQAISEIINEHLKPLFPFIDFNGFSMDVETKQGSQIKKFPVGCNVDIDTCNSDELEYLLPQSNKSGIAFYDNISSKGSEQIQGVNYTNIYIFDLVVWVNKTVKFTNTEFCSRCELIYNHLYNAIMDLKADNLTFEYVGLPKPYMSSKWKFEDKVDFLNAPYCAFRIPITVKFNFCASDLTPLDYTIEEC